MTISSALLDIAEVVECLRCYSQLQIAYFVLSGNFRCQFSIHALYPFIKIVEKYKKAYIQRTVHLATASSTVDSVQIELVKKLVKLEELSIKILSRSPQFLARSSGRLSHFHIDCRRSGSTSISSVDH